MKTLFFMLLFSTSLSAQYRGYILCDIPQSKAHVSIYINSIWDDCEQISKEYNIPLGLIIAQCCLESGFGRSNYAKTRNNHLGIKYEGVYACFESFRHCLDSYARVVTKACYKDLQPRTLMQWVEALSYECCTYAVSDKYGKKLKSIIKTYNLDVIPYNYRGNEFVNY